MTAAVRCMVLSAALLVAAAARGEEAAPPAEAPTGAPAAAPTAAPPPKANEFYVDPDGRSDGDGSKEKPWDLATALAHPPAVKPGDTLWLRDGTYAGAFTSRLKGTAEAPITVRQAPGARATIDCVSRDPKQPVLFTVEGEWARFWGFEVMSSNPKRRTEAAGSHPEEINRGGVNCFGSNIAFINMVVHECSNGFGFWSNGEGGEIYGCIIYNNGWDAPDRGHGHAIYAQNKAGTKRIVDNVMFNQFCYGLHAYGSSKASLSGFHVEGNVSFNNGAAKGAEALAPALLVGGGCPAERIEVVSNYTYSTGCGAPALQLGYGAKNKDAVVKGNYFVGPVSLQLWNRLQVSGNTFIAPEAPVRLRVAQVEAGALGEWSENMYINMSGKEKIIALSSESQSAEKTLYEWRREFGQDRGSMPAPGRSIRPRVFVRPNAYEPGRAHIIVYNWDKRDLVELELGKILRPRMRFKIVSAQDFFGPPLMEGRYEGRMARLPMKEYRALPPLGKDGYQPPATGPEFNVFVVVPLE